MTQPPGAPPPPGYPGNPWQTPPGGEYPPPAPQNEPPAPPYQPPAPPYQPTAPVYQPPSAPQTGFVPSQPPVSGGPVAYPGSAPPSGFPPFYPTAPAPPRRRGLLITVIVLVVLVILGGGGLAVVYLLNRGSDGIGKSSPTAAAQSFLEAIYVDQDATKAAPLVCSAARDKKKLTAKINQIKQQDQQYDTPKYTWSTLTTQSSAKDHVVISTTVTLTTANVQQASQKLKLTVVKRNGWFVCDVQQ